MTGLEIKLKRVGHRIKLSELADTIGMNKAMLSRIENEKIKLTPKSLTRINEGFDKILGENKELPRDEWEDCPACANCGGYVERHPHYVDGDEESMGYPVLVGFGETHIQCEFCWTNPRSVFYQQNKLWKNK